VFREDRNYQEILSGLEKLGKTKYLLQPAGRANRVRVKGWKSQDFISLRKDLPCSKIIKYV